jgi:hypothetical protein
MIKDNIIYFGFGTVAVGSDFYSLTLSQIKPPQEVGTDLTKVSDIEYFSKVIINLSYKECNGLNKLLDDITEYNCIVSIQGYILNFEKYNKKSIVIVKKHINNILYWYNMCMAA